MKKVVLISGILLLPFLGLTQTQNESKEEKKEQKEKEKLEKLNALLPFP